MFLLSSLDDGDADDVDVEKLKTEKKGKERNAEERIEEDDDDDEKPDKKIEPIESSWVPFLKFADNSTDEYLNTLSDIQVCSLPFLTSNPIYL